MKNKLLPVLAVLAAWGGTALAQEEERVRSEAVSGEATLAQGDKDDLVKITKKRIPMDKRLLALCVGPQRVLGPHVAAEVDIFVNPTVIDYRRKNPDSFAYPVGSKFVKKKYPRVGAKTPDIATLMVKKTDTGKVTDWKFSMVRLSDGRPLTPRVRTSCADCHQRYEARGYISRQSEHALQGYLHSLKQDGAGQSAGIAKSGVQADDTVRKTTAYLIEAARKGDLEAVNAALAADVSPNGPPGQLTALHWAVARRIHEGETIEPSPAITRQLIAAGADVNAKDYLGQTPLEWAAKHGSPNVVKMLIKAGADVNAQSVYGTVLMAGARTEIAKLLIAAGADVNAGKTMTPLAKAAKYGNAAMIRLLVEHGAKVNDPGQPAIHWAQNPESARALLEAKADVNQRNAKEETVLHLPYAPFVPTAETVQLLLKAGANVHPKSKSGSTPLHAASRLGKSDIAGLLIAAGANVGAKDLQGNTPLSLANATLSWARGNESVENKPYAAVVQLLVDAGAKDDGRTELQRTVAAGNWNEVKKLIASGVDVNAIGPQRITAVHIASEKGRAEILVALIEGGARADQPDAQGMRPLHLAANAEIARTLIARGAKVNAGTPGPLYMATSSGKADVVRELIRNKANVKDSDCAGMLNWATFFGRVEVVKVLLERQGVKALLKAPAIYSPLHIAASGSLGDMNNPQHVTPQRRLEIAKLLVKSGTDVNARWGAGVNPKSGAAHIIDTTPLMFASSKGEPEMVEFLLERGANIKATNANGRTALHFATESATANRAVVDALLKAKANVNALTHGGKTPLDLARDAEIKILLIQNGGKTSRKQIERR